MAGRTLLLALRPTQFFCKAVVVVDLAEQGIAWEPPRDNKAEAYHHPDQAGPWNYPASPSHCLHPGRRVACCCQLDRSHCFLVADWVVTLPHLLHCVVWAKLENCERPEDRQP